MRAIAIKDTSELELVINLDHVVSMYAYSKGGDAKKFGVVTLTSVSEGANDWFALDQENFLELKREMLE